MAPCPRTKRTLESFEGEANAFPSTVFNALARLAYRGTITLARTYIEYINTFFFRFYYEGQMYCYLVRAWMDMEERMHGFFASTKP
jgi:hypothetical protein